MNGSLASATRAAPAPAIPMRDYRIDGWLVQPALNRLVKGVTAIRIRPQLIDLLGYLATQPGKVVSKTQLLDAVWSDRFVSSSGIARCVAELRQVLADDARQPRIIETINKRGYRLIARVEPADEPTSVPAEPEPSRSTPAAGVPCPVASADETRPGNDPDGGAAWWRDLVTAVRSVAMSGVVAAAVRHVWRDALR